LVAREKESRERKMRQEKETRTTCDGAYKKTRVRNDRGQWMMVNVVIDVSSV